MTYPFKVRQEIFDTYWKFAKLRQDIFFARYQDKPGPWVNDPVLNTYKFTNTYRASDRVSQFLIKNVIYKGNFSPEDTIFRIILFKIFNKIETWQTLEKKFGKISLKNFNFQKYSQVLEEIKNFGTPIYTSAYMSCANKAFGYKQKHQNHLALLEKMFLKDKMQNKILKAKTLKEIFEILVAYPLIGNFMAYQLAIDLNYSTVIDFNENDFTIAGPGAMRGIEKCFINTGNLNNAEIILWMVENQDKEFKRLSLDFKNLWGRKLTAIDCQNIFCEVDKYSRVAFADLKSNRKNIKHKFKANKKRIDYFYPPKWNLNK